MEVDEAIGHHLVEFVPQAARGGRRHDSVVVESVASVEWPGMLHGRALLNLDVPPRGSNEVGVFRISANTGRLRRVLLVCHYGTTDQASRCR